MGGSKPSAPVHYRHKPTAPIIYQTIQSQEGWDAADDFLKRLRSDRDAIVKDQAAVLGASNAAAYAREQKKYQSAATTAENPMWESEQAARSKISAADAAGDKTYLASLSTRDKGYKGKLSGTDTAYTQALGLEDQKRQQTLLSEDQKRQKEERGISAEEARKRAIQLASLVTQQGSGYEPPKPSGSK